MSEVVAVPTSTDNRDCIAYIDNCEPNSQMRKRQIKYELETTVKESLKYYELSYDIFRTERNGKKNEQIFSGQGNS